MQETCCICLPVPPPPPFVWLVMITLLLKHDVQMSGKTEVNCGLSLPAIFLQETLPSNQIFAEIYGRHSHMTTSLSAQNGSTAVNLASAAVTANASVVCFTA